VGVSVLAPTPLTVAVAPLLLRSFQEVVPDVRTPTWATSSPS
jgi:hypothetical protein